MANNDEGFYLNWKIKSNDDILVYTNFAPKLVYTKLNRAKAARWHICVGEEEKKLKCGWYTDKRDENTLSKVWENSRKI